MSIFVTMEVNKLICIEQRNYINITKGKLYYTKSSRITTDVYWIVDDYGNLRGLDKNLFITLDEHRDLQINKVLNNYEV